MANVIKRNPINISATYDQLALKERFENMLVSVGNMLQNDGPIYSVWIYFQIGMSENNAVVFNTASTDRKQNLIASLNIDKNGSGIANKFTLTVQYDPFNYGQETTDEIEILDEFIASAMAENFNLEGDNTKSIRGKLQYGYNSTSDDDLVSPLYEFYLTGATSNVQFDSGITSYTFEGVSTISADCDFSTVFPAIKEETPLLPYVAEILYKFYGDPDNKPSYITSDVVPYENDYHYIIDIPSNLVDKCAKIPSNEVKASTMSPFAYCKWLLDQYPLTTDEQQEEKYQNLEGLSAAQRPRYSVYLTDASDHKTIHIVHFSPSSTIEADGQEVVTETSDLKIDYTFSWGKRGVDTTNRNIIVNWQPQVDLYSYLIRRALRIRYSNEEANIKALMESDPTNEEYKKLYNRYKDIGEEVLEAYNAELKLVGIPTDPPLAAEVKILPQILEKESRTRGIYSITGATDDVSTNGVFTTTLKLFRLRGLNYVQVNNKITVDVAQDTKVSPEQQARIEYLNSLDTGEGYSGSGSSRGF